MADTRILCLGGDGIGHELMQATRRVLDRVNETFSLGLVFEQAEIGLEALKKTGTTFPEEVFEKARAAEGVVLGPVSHNEYPPVEQGGRNPSGDLRKRLDLYANIRPARCRGGFTPVCGKPIDLVIVRENTEGFYASGARRIHADA